MSGQNAQHCETETLEEKNTKNNCPSTFRETKLTQTSGSVFADRIELFKKTKFELEIKNVDCFPDGHVNYTSNLVSFKINSLKLTFF